MTTVTNPTPDYITIPLTEIDARDELNIRQVDHKGRYAGVEELAADIAAHGLKDPLVIRSKANGGKFQLLDGFRRYAALSHNGVKEVKVRIKICKDDKAALIAHAKANLARRSFNSYELASLYSRMRRDHKMQAKSISDALSAGGDTPLDPDTINNWARVVEKLDPAILAVWADPSYEQHKLCTFGNLTSIVGGKDKTHAQQLAEWDKLCNPSVSETGSDETAEVSEDEETESVKKKAARPSPALIAACIIELEGSGLKGNTVEVVSAALVWCMKGGKLKIGDWKFDPAAVAKEAAKAKEVEKAEKLEAKAKYKAEKEAAKVATAEAKAKVVADAKAKLEALDAKAKVALQRS